MKIGIIGNLAKESLPRVAADLVANLRERKINFAVEENLAAAVNREMKHRLVLSTEAVSSYKLPSRCDILVAFGGDGTILSAARLVGKRETPILGVNLGKLGFLAEFAVAEMDEWIDAVRSGKYKVERRMVLEATTHSGRQKRFLGLNDIVIDKTGSSRVIELRTYVNDDYLITYAGDGLILATPTGSTAYSLATGGPIVVPETQAITLSPIGPHTLTARPVLVPEDSLIRVVAEKDAKAVHITADGQVEEILRPPVEIKIRKASHCAKLIKRLDRTYYDILRAKLMWGRDVRVDVARDS
jgi:NAD+ kinase